MNDCVITHAISAAKVFKLFDQIDFLRFPDELQSANIEEASLVTHEGELMQELRRFAPKSLKE